MVAFIRLNFSATALCCEHRQHFLAMIVSFSLSAVAGAGLEEGPLAASLTQLVADPSYLVSLAPVLGCC
jgi:hypothetical protein